MPRHRLHHCPASVAVNNLFQTTILVAGLSGRVKARAFVLIRDTGITTGNPLTHKEEGDRDIRLSLSVSEVDPRRPDQRVMVEYTPNVVGKHIIKVVTWEPRAGTGEAFLHNNVAQFSIFLDVT